VGDGAYGPFVSPDGEWVGYFAGGAIHKVSITGGPPVMICAANRPLGASWGPNDQMVFSSNAALFRVSAGGGKPELLAAPHISKVEATYGYPEILPGGRALLFTIVPNASPGDRNQIAVLDLETRRTRVLIRGGSTPRYAPSGHLVYAAAGSLRAVRFDVDRLEMHGNPVPVVEHVATKGLTGAANFGIARNGTTLVYRTGTAVVGLLHTMVWVDRHGHEEPLGLAPRAYVRADLSPDGTKLALDIRDQENDIWVWNLTRRGPLTPLTFDPGLNRGGLWSPDGRKIVFTAVRDAAENLYWQAADGTGTVERLTHSRRAQLPRAFTPDGTQLLFDEAGDMGAVNLTGDRRTTRRLQGPHWEANGEISPDGRWLAYESDESQRAEIYVRPFPNVHSGRWKVSTGGGTRPAWARSGRELFYYVPGRLMAVSVQMGTTPTFGTPHVVVDGAYVAPIGGRNYVVSPDGQRFLMIKDATPQTSSTAPPPSQLVVVLNWLEELKRLVPTN
jgi:hypothetical protein